MISEWYKNVEQVVDNSSKEYISKRDNLFYQVWRLKNIAKQFENIKPSLSDKTYEKNKKDFSYILDNLDLLINKSGNNKSEYEDRFSAVLKYLKQEHGVYLPLYFASHYSFIFMCIGLALSSIYSFLVFASFIWMVLIITTGIFAAVGYFIGSMKDSKIKKEGKQI